MEYGLCREGNGVKAYGAGLLSSYGELQYALGDKSEHKVFDPFKDAIEKYPLTRYQHVYYVSESFEGAKEKMM